MTNMKRDELLTQLATDMKWVKKSLSNHLCHHEKIEGQKFDRQTAFTVLWVSVTVAAAVSFIVAVWF